MFEFKIYHRKMGFTNVRRIEADTFVEARKKLFQTFDKDVWSIRSMNQIKQVKYE